MRLLRAHYQEGKHQGSGKGLVLLIVLVLLALAAGLVWAAWAVWHWAAARLAAGA